METFFLVDGFGFNLTFHFLLLTNPTEDFSVVRIMWPKKDWHASNLYPFFTRIQPPNLIKIPFTVRANTPVEQNRSHETANQPHIFRTSIHWGLCGRCLRGVSLGLLTKQPTPADDDALVRQLEVPPVLFCSSRCWGGTVPFLCGMECYQTTLFCHFWRTRRTRACLTPARSQTSGTTSTMISSPTGSGAWIRYRSEVPDWYEQEILSGKRKTSWRWS